MTAEPAGARSRALRAYAFASRLLLAHVLAYPLAFVWAIAAMPLAIHLRYEEVERLVAAEGPHAGAVGRYVVRLVAWPAAVAFAIPHLAVLPHALGVGGPGARKAYLGLTAALGALALVAGAASWIWLFTL